MAQLRGRDCTAISLTGASMKLVSIIEMCFNETCGKVRTGKHLSATFPLESVLIQADDVARMNDMKVKLSLC
jgi:hypothetical protein